MSHKQNTSDHKNHMNQSPKRKRVDSIKLSNRTQKFNQGLFNQLAAFLNQ